MKPVLLDTGCLVALLDRSEQHHGACVSAVAGLQAPLVTCEPVIAEACYLLRRLPAAVDSVLANVEQRIFQIPLRLETQAGAVRALLKRYARVPMDLADACLVHLAGELGTGEILTLDRDFQIYRWNRTKPFRLLVDLSS
jgi:predicted nucleic acid-binding protein